MTYKEKEMAQLWHGIKSARSLAHRSRLIAQIYPKYEREEMRECARHFARAHWYLDSLRMLRASQ
jgi:hypothetical protein